VEPVTGAGNGAMEILETEPPLLGMTKDSDIPAENTSEVIAQNADHKAVVENDTPPSSPNTCCDVNTNVQHRVKMKGRLRQQLQKRHRRRTSGNTAKTCAEKQPVEIQKSDGSVYGQQCSTTAEAGNPASSDVIPGAKPANKSHGKKKSASQVCSLLCLLGPNVF